MLERFSSILVALLVLPFVAESSLLWENSFVLPDGLRIVGGQEAAPHQFPYQAGLYIEYDLSEIFCGGSLISVHYVLTAAHCVQGAVSIKVELGAQNITDESESTKQIFVSANYTLHPDWNITSLTNDVAVIALPTPAVLSDDVQLITLSSGSETYANDIGTTIGWGKTSDDQTGVTDILRYESNTILSNEDCKNTDDDYAKIIRDTHVCLSGEGVKSICKGDSGGPLVARGIQIGISSFSYKSCEAEKPSVFTRVSQFYDWIKDNSDITN